MISGPAWLRRKALAYDAVRAVVLGEKHTPAAVRKSTFFRGCVAALAEGTADGVLGRPPRRKRATMYMLGHTYAMRVRHLLIEQGWTPPSSAPPASV